MKIMIEQKMIDRRRELTELLETGKINPAETEELKSILEKELEMARNVNDIPAMIAISVIIGILAVRTTTFELEQGYK